MRRAIEYVTGSRLVLALVLLALVLQVASRLGDYLVAVLFVSATHNNLQALTILVGNAWLVSYVVQLVVSLVITPWVLQRLGVKNAILVLPLFTLVGFAAVAFNPVLATALFLFIVRNGLQTGLDDPSQNVLGGALPAQVVPKLRFLLDNLVLPGAAVITGVGLLLVQRAGMVSVEVLALLGIGTGVVFAIAAWRVRAQYLDAIYARLRAHALNLSDFQQAVGRPTPDEVAELQAYVRGPDDKAREFAAAALARAAPDAFAMMLPELVASQDAVVRRLAFQMASPDAFTIDELEAAGADEDGWVRAAAAVAGLMRRERWSESERTLALLAASDRILDRAAAAWAAAFTADDAAIAAAMSDRDPRVRREALRSFARMKGRVSAAAGPLIACMRDEHVEVRRDALRQAIRWSPPEDWRQSFAEALADSLVSGDRDVRRLAAEAMAAQAPEALTLTLPLLLTRDETAAAAVEALMRSGQPELYKRARAHLENQLAHGLHLARLSARARVDYPLLRIGLDDYVDSAAQSAMAAMRALHGKRGFATVERGLVSVHPETRMEALETLLNFG
ncbi:MAG TPA: hypothetical protein VKE27_12910, partial [Candidatus Dormibacteraeota bacterium]|nr:hypothetical protein [Candidatus Dormibacteraeota bacterium]